MRLLAIAILLCATGMPAPAQAPARYKFEVIHSFPHDAAAFTQGLEYRNGFLYEGTGLQGRSSLRKVRLETGEIVRRIDLSPEFFGEGITLVGNEVLQVTWQSETGFVYRLSDFGLLRRFTYKGEGWGLTSDGRGEVFMSDGSSEIRVLDAKTLSEKRRIRVRDGESPVDQLNELEFVEGEIFANVWLTDRIARISPATGKVTGWIDMRGIDGPTDREVTGAVLNGIAYDSAAKRLFVTGKMWPRVFEIRLIPAN
jgi:glutaminyl-peptide cyclotransferase